MRYPYLGLAAAVCAMVVVPRIAPAFDPRTHVWVGQQVLNDVVDDGQVEIDGRHYPVNPVLVDALRRFPAAYRMGHIGPDAHPDLLAGQSFTHPGVDSHWRTDEWMRWVQDQAGASPEAMAYAYGFWGHAAGDVIAHTYVNTYAGDSFDLADESEVEQRHFNLEHYIGDRTPALRDHERRLLGRAYDDGVVRAPYEFIARTLILNQTVYEQYSKKPHFGAHLMAMYKVKEVVGQAAQESKALTLKTNQRLQQVLEAFAGPQLLADEAAETLESLPRKVEQIEERLPGLEEAERVARQVFDKVDAGAMVIQRDLDRAEAAAARAQSQVDALQVQLTTTIENELSRAQRQVNDAQSRVDALTEDIAAYVNERDEKDKTISDLVGKVSNAEGALSRLISTRSIGLPGFTRTVPVYLPGYSEAKSHLESLEADRINARARLDEVRVSLSAARPRLNQWESRLLTAEKNRERWLRRQVDAPIELQKAQAALTTARADIDRIRQNVGSASEPLRQARDTLQQAEEAHNQARAALENLREQIGQATEVLTQARDAIGLHALELRKLQEIYESISDVSAFFERWERDIDRATNKYVEAATQALINTLKPEPESTPLGTRESAVDPTKPLMDWLFCYAPVFTGIPYEAGRTVCDVRSRYSEALSKVDESLYRAEKWAYEVVPFAELAKTSLERLKEELIQAGLAFGERTIGEKYTQVYNLHGRDVTPEELNDVFRRDTSGKNLLEFRNIVQIVNRDLGLRSSSAELQLNRCTLLRHAVNMVKLTVLGPQALNSIGSNYQIPSGYESVYGSTKLYPEEPPMGDTFGFVNVLYKAAGNIDGNHQWRGIGLPYARRGSVELKCGQTFGYCRTSEGDAKDYGFRLWVDPLYRQRVFPMIFPGDPAWGIRRFLPANYDDIASGCLCENNPVQDTGEDGNDEPQPTPEELAKQEAMRNEVQVRLDASVNDSDIARSEAGAWPRDLSIAYSQARTTNRPLVIVVEDSQDPDRQLGPVQYVNSRLHNELLAPYERCLIDVSSPDGKRQAGNIGPPCLFIVNPHTRRTITFRGGQIEASEWAQLLLTHKSLTPKVARLTSDSTMRNGDRMQSRLAKSHLPFNCSSAMCQQRMRYNGASMPRRSCRICF